MNLQHVNAKVLVDGAMRVDPARFIDVFHQWIRDSVFDELLIDVADYRHVPAGPGVLLVGSEADYSMDNTDGFWGLRYNRKAPLEGTNEDRFVLSLRSALRACRLLEAHFASDEALRFSRTAFELFINDRALAPNTPETYTHCAPELKACLTRALGHGAFRLEHRDDPRRRFGVTVTVDQPFDLNGVLEALDKHR